MSKNVADRIQASAYGYMRCLLERQLEKAKTDAAKLSLIVSRQKPEWEQYQDMIYDALIMAAEDTFGAGIDVAREAEIMNRPSEGDQIC